MRVRALLHLGGPLQVSSADASLAVRVLFDPKAASASFLQWKDGHTFNTAVAAGLVMLSDPAVGIPSEQDAVFFKALAGVAASGVIAIQQHAAVESLDETLPLPRDLEVSWCCVRFHP